MITLPPLLPPPPASGSSWLEGLEAALEAEREALLAGDAERLVRATQDKSMLLESLAAPDAPARRQARGIAPARLRELAARNRRNGLLIAERLGEVQRRRQFFEQMAGRSGVYGPDGVTLPAAAPRLSARI